MKTTRNVIDLKENEVFVFGSNLSGRHGAGAAKQAMEFGAEWGKGVGLYGQTYGIPTVDASVIGKLSLDKIDTFIQEFIRFAREHKELQFLVTAIGCGLAGWTPEDIAPLFLEATTLENVSLPREFWKVLNQ